MPTWHSPVQRVPRPFLESALHNSMGLDGRSAQTPITMCLGVTHDFLAPLSGGVRVGVRLCTGLGVLSQRWANGAGTRRGKPERCSVRRPAHWLTPSEGSGSGSSSTGFVSYSRLHRPHPPHPRSASCGMLRVGVVEPIIAYPYPPCARTILGSPCPWLRVQTFCPRSRSCP